VVNGKPGRWFDAISNGSVTFLYGQHIAYFATEGAQWFIVVSDREGKRFTRCSFLAQIIFSNNTSPAEDPLPLWVNENGTALAYMVTDDLETYNDQNSLKQSKIIAWNVLTGAWKESPWFAEIDATSVRVGKTVTFRASVEGNLSEKYADQILQVP
jgi:hypothetical protein